MKMMKYLPVRKCNETLYHYVHTKQCAVGNEICFTLKSTFKRQIRKIKIKIRK